MYFLKNKGHLKRADGLPQWLSGKESTCNAEDMVQSLVGKIPLDKEMVTHSSIFFF